MAVGADKTSLGWTFNDQLQYLRSHKQKLLGENQGQSVRTRHSEWPFATFARYLVSVSYSSSVSFLGGSPESLQVHGVCPNIA
ncbi:unnamed protein product [Sphagnum tenellum]